MIKLEEKESKELDILYDQQLVDDIVYKGLAEKEKVGDLALYNEYHEKRDAIYEIEQEQRPKRFKALDNEFFNRLGYDGYITEMFDEFPNIKEIVEEVHVRRATTRQNEGSNVVDEGRKVIIRLYPELFIEGKEMRKVLRHELMHVSDMMDEKFGYKADDEFGLSPMEERIIRDRYRLFWDIYVDGRLVNKGLETTATRVERKREFDSFFGKISQESRDNIFKKIWGAEESLTHDRMVELAKDTNKVLELAEEGRSPEEFEEETKKVGPLPGTTCSLCGFPSFDWVEDIVEDEDVVKVLKEDFPDWEPHDGVCSRCAEYYKIRVGKW